jgi:hypothetical protein
MKIAVTAPRVQPDAPYRGPAARIGRVQRQVLRCLHDRRTGRVVLSATCGGPPLARLSDRGRPDHVVCDVGWGSHLHETSYRSGP